MIFSFVNPERQAYLLGHRFRMPTSSGTKDAIAVSKLSGDQLVSAYTFILDHIVMVVCGIGVLAGVLLSTRQYGHDHAPSLSVSKEVFSKKANPMSLLQAVMGKFLGRQDVRKLVVIWVAFSVVSLTIRYAIPIVFARYIKIGNVAPVNPNAIFVPSRNNTGSFSDTSNANNLEIFNFYVPAALRAVGTIDGFNRTLSKNPPLSVAQPEIIGVDEAGGLIIRYGYQYNVTGLDFGLQHYPELHLNVQGSCVTEYNWWAGSSNDVSIYPGAFVEEYIPFNNPDNTQFVSLYDGGPRAFFHANPPAPSMPTNSTWAAVISSVNRTSWFPSTDPWYQTDVNPFYNANQIIVAPYMVMPQRPVLSCWENDVWSYRGYNGSITDLPTMPGLNLPPGLSTIFVDSLGSPMIYLLGTYLQVSALASSVTALSNILDANSSSIFKDLERLVYASYLATVNCLTETTMFPPSNGFLNEVAPGGVLLRGTGDFVIYSNDIDTLSMHALIIIPVVLVSLWIFSMVLLVICRGTVKTVDPRPRSEADAAKQTESSVKKITDSISRAVKEIFSLAGNAAKDG